MEYIAIQLYILIDISGNYHKCISNLFKFWFKYFIIITNNNNRMIT